MATKRRVQHLDKTPLRFQRDIASWVAWGSLASIGAVLFAVICTGIVSGIQSAACEQESPGSVTCSIAILVIAAVIALVIGAGVAVALFRRGGFLDFWFFIAFVAGAIGLLVIMLYTVGLAGLLSSWMWLLFLFVPALAALASASWSQHRPWWQKTLLICACIAAVAGFAYIIY